MAKDEPRKKGKKKWVRYERSHLVPFTWTGSSMKGMESGFVQLDDASMILAAGEFDNATAENSIKLLDEAYNKYLHIALIREVITDQVHSSMLTREIRRERQNTPLKNTAGERE